jgi:type II secretory pathway pseudopilin PulG
MNRPQLKRMTIVIAACASAGAIAGIAGSAAAPSSKSKSGSAQAQAQKQAQKLRARALRRGFRLGPVGPGFARGPVHAEAVVPNAAGTGFTTITTDAGTLKSVDGTTVHLKEGTDKATYKDDVAIDVGSNAKVIRNHQDAKLTDLKAGDHVRVITGAPRGNVVIAEDDAFIAQEKKRFRQFKKQFRDRGFHHRGFGFGFGPPSGAPAPGGYPGDQGGAQPGSSSAGTNS